MYLPHEASSNCMWARPIGYLESMGKNKTKKLTKCVDTLLATKILENMIVVTLICVLTNSRETPTTLRVDYPFGD